MLKIAICIKQVPNSDNVKFNWKKGALIRKNIENMLNPDDYHAIELGLQLKERYGGEITVLTLGPQHAEEVLREAYAFSCDKCVLITDPVFAGSDSLITSKILYKTINKLGKFDVILTGFETTDGNTSQVSYQLSEFFAYPHLTQIKSVDVQLEEKIIIAERLYGHEYQKIRSPLPVIIACNRETNVVRYPKLKDIKHAFEKPITIITSNDIDGDTEQYGASGSPTKTIQGEITVHKRKKEVFKGDLDEKVDETIKKLKKYGIIKV